MVQMFTNNKDITGHVMEKTHTTIDHPLYIGKCIIDDSKEEMYGVYYDNIKTVEGFNDGTWRYATATPIHPF